MEMEKTMLSCIASLLIFSLVLSTMPQGTVSIGAQQCIIAAQLPCNVAQDCPNCNSPYVNTCMEPEHMCGCCI
ncbi:hypothetical protein Scep_025364 [Stephania cephalantha]|uniref:Uncharacterized protein n=1 Tax=Stephania cephalantha TaxID=152367 RepID=A0AAP0EI31_9MAGN